MRAPVAGWWHWPPHADHWSHALQLDASVKAKVLNLSSIPSLDDIVRQGKVYINPKGFPLQEILGDRLAVTV